MFSSVFWASVEGVISGVGEKLSRSVEFPEYFCNIREKTKSMELV